MDRYPPTYKPLARHGQMGHLGCQYGLATREGLPSAPETSPYPGGVKTFVEEGRSTELRGIVLTELGSLAVIDCEESGKFKFGADSVDGWMLGVIEVHGLGLVGYRKQVPAYLDQPYGHGCIAEVYNSDRYPYFEMEIHGPVFPLRPGESIELEERQVVFDLSRWPNSEDEVRQYLGLGP